MTTAMLDAVYDFVQTYACDAAQGIPPYRDDQILIGWQNTGLLPVDSAEFCVITPQASTRHGTNCREMQGEGADTRETWAETLEQEIQLDFCSAEPPVRAETTQTRAAMIELLAYSEVATDFFHRADPGLTCLFADGVQALPFFDPGEVYTARFMVRLHLERRLEVTLPAETFTAVTVRPGMTVTPAELDTPPGEVPPHGLYFRNADVRRNLRDGGI